MATIAVVDDDPGLRTLIQVHLQRAGHQVTTERTGAGGLEMIRRTMPDLVVLDWMMPRMSGIEVCEHMRRDPRLASIPVLMLTARSGSGDIATARHAGADDYMLKPFQGAELTHTVNRLLAARVESG